ncbi:MAG: S1C family serine protease [Pseudohongiellaceae bacterium]
MKPKANRAIQQSPRRSLRPVLALILLLVWQALPAQSAGASASANAETGSTANAIENSVVKIYATQVAPDYFTPWRLLSPRQSTGSGTVITGNRILTNAHVVANASYVQAQKHNDARRYQARVILVSHEADLALLTVEEPGFFDNAKPLPLGELPAPLQEVSVYGYPIGGRSLSITKGILSRLEHQVYSHAGSYLFAGQIDAAINPGNSGGPVIVNQEIVGVVMQAGGAGRAENLGYFVPPSVVRHVLADSEDGELDGFPDLGFRTQTLDSPAAKIAYGLSAEQSGALVIKVFDESPVQGMIEENDVILKIDDFSIEDDGSIRLTDKLFTDYKHAIDLHHVGDMINITYSRRGEVKTAEVQASPALDNYRLVAGEKFDELPEYYVYGGVLFVPLNMNLIKRWGNDWARAAPVSMLQARGQWSSPERREVVVALQVLAADVNLGYHDWRNWVVDYINGEQIRDFAHFAKMLRDNDSEDVVFENENGYQMVINHEDALAGEAAVLNQYRIPAPYSPGLFAGSPAR